MKTLLIVGSLVLASAVIIGAFGAHALKARLAPDMLQIYQTGVEYHFYHGLGILLIGVIGMQLSHSLIHTAGWVLTLGVLVFSGSLYVLALTGMRWLGAVTPLGGLAFIIGWVLLAIGVYRSAMP